MLVWLDATANRKAKPNENYAREVMELFTLGRGRYTEKDIREAARAFTGWFVVRDRFSMLPTQHDDGVKTIFGKTGRFRGDDVPGLLLDQPACAEFLCRASSIASSSARSTRPRRALLAPLAKAPPRRRATTSPRPSGRSSGRTSSSTRPSRRSG